MILYVFFFFFSSRRRHTRCSRDWSSDVCSSDLWLEYNTDLFEENTVRQLLEHFEMLLRGVAATPERRIAELPMLKETERQQLLVEWNDTRAGFPTGRCIHELFEAQAEKTPAAIAL